MGPMGPRGLGPWALWAPGALGPNYENFEKSKICQKMLLRTSNDPQDSSQMIQKNFGNLSIFWKMLGPSRVPDHQATEGDWIAPTHFARPSARPPGVFFWQKRRPPKKECVFTQKIGVFVYFLYFGKC